MMVGTCRSRHALITAGTAPGATHGVTRWLGVVKATRQTLKDQGARQPGEPRAQAK